MTVRTTGTRRIYGLDQTGLATAQAWLSQLTDPLGPFAQPLDALATEVARGRLARRVATEREHHRGASGDGPTARSGSQAG